MFASYFRFCILKDFYNNEKTIHIQSNQYRGRSASLSSDEEVDTAATAQQFIIDASCAAVEEEEDDANAATPISRTLRPENGRPISDHYIQRKDRVISPPKMGWKLT